MTAHALALLAVGFIVGAGIMARVDSSHLDALLRQVDALHRIIDRRRDCPLCEADTELELRALRDPEGFGDDLRGDSPGFGA